MNEQEGQLSPDEQGVLSPQDTLSRGLSSIPEAQGAYEPEPEPARETSEMESTDGSRIDVEKLRGAEQGVVENILGAIKETAQSHPSNEGTVIFLDENQQIGQEGARQAAADLLKINFDSDQPIIDNSRYEGTVIYQPNDPGLQRRGVYYVENRKPGTPRNDGVNDDGSYNSEVRGTRAIIVLDPRCPRPNLETPFAAVLTGNFIGWARTRPDRAVGEPQKFICWAGMDLSRKSSERQI